MVTKTEAIKAFLINSTHSDLAALYNYNMECQVNVGQDGGTRVEGDYRGRQWHGWTDSNGLEVWKSFRIPFNAATEPTYNDGKMSFSLDKHAEGIGMTGWDWKNRVSRWVAYDFDAITGHSDKHTSKLTTDELIKVQEAACGIPWVTVRKSTSGKGLHLYVFLEGVETANHHEHAALGRAILGKMASEAGFDFAAKVDICGGNMWCWHRKMLGTDGLSLIKQGERLLQIPINWRDHVKVIKGRRPRAVPKFIEESEVPEAERLFNELCGQRSTAVLDDTHKKLIKFLEDSKAQFWWDNDHGMLVCHTYDLLLAHDALNFRGIFRTEAKGTEKGADHNCFSGNVEVLTKDGPKTFKELVGQKVELYVKTDSGMKWILSEIKSFGKQETFPIRFGDQTEVRATYNHMWLVRNKQYKIPTHDIVEGKTQLPLATFDLPEIDYEAYAHGFVFGDGWEKQNKGKWSTEVALFKHDNDLLNLLCKYGAYGTQYYAGHGHVNVVRQLPLHWKSLPKNPSKSYALGFIIGLASADGFVDKRLQIFQSNWEVVETVRKLGIYCGLRPFEVRVHNPGSYSNKNQAYAITFSTYNLTKNHFLRKDHQEKFDKREKQSCTTVSNIDWTSPKLEEVYCAVVPHWHNFTLANLVITGNCYGFPIRAGAWAVRRFTPGVKEDPIWTQDGSGWTMTYLNRQPDLQSASRAFEGVESEKGGFHFPNAELAVKAAQLLGVNLDLKHGYLTRPAVLKATKDGRLMLSFENGQFDKKDELPGFLNEKNRWQRIFNVQVGSSVEDTSVANLDDTVRHIVTSARDDAGWVIRSDERWSAEPLTHVKEALKSLGYSQKDSGQIVGQAVTHPWEITNLPFQPEYPGGRKWNRDAAQFRFPPATDKDELKFPTWLKIFNHLGSDLDTAVQKNVWCKANGIISGSDYLMCWVASLFQEPTQPLPYLFFWSIEQNTGKSIFHESLSLLLTKGYQRADHALMSQSTFNGELENAILCVVEETDLQKNSQASNRIKDWVTAPMLSIRHLYQSPYMIQNTTHWVQASNDPKSCLVLPGDTRIVMIHVPKLNPLDMIPKKEMLVLLEAEAPDFLASVLRLEIPKSNDRLHIPIVETEDKLSTARSNQSELESFIAEKFFYVPGAMVNYGQFYDEFLEYLDPSDHGRWSKIKVGRSLPARNPKGRAHTDNHYYIGNLSSKPQEGPVQKRLIVRDEYLEIDNT